MKKINVLIIALIIGLKAIVANPVPFTTAQTVATNFYTQTKPGSSPNLTLAYTEYALDGQPVYYVFDVNANDGFVIISAEDATIPVLGYSTTGTFIIPVPGNNIDNWMQSKKNEILSIRALGYSASPAINDEWTSYRNNTRPHGTHNTMSFVLPLCQTLWDQSPYYNDMCPGGSVTGCVATAMAQIMKFWDYPAHGIDSLCWDDMYPVNYGNLCENFDTSNYKWAEMPNSVFSTNYQVAKLMYDCGVGILTHYSPSASAANMVGPYPGSAQYAFVQYFGYNPSTINGLYRTSYSDSQWITLLETELNDGRPVQLDGGGHSWVCDGYDAINDMHMNWGWSGFDNGYYNVDSLNPSPYNLNSSEHALTGIEPPSVLAYFTATPTYGCSSVTVHFTDRSLVNSSSNPITAWNWTFTGGTPSTSTMQNPTIVYNTPGSYAVTLQVTNSLGNNTITQTGLVNIGNLKVTATIDPRCGGTLATAVVSSGIAPFTYLWSTGSTASSVNSLSTGTYTISVTDNFGCTASTTAVIAPYLPLIMTTVAGNGVQGYSGDGGQAKSAEMYFPEAIAEDVSGNLYITDTPNNAIRKVDGTGIITTIIGEAGAGYSGDGGPASAAEMSYPWGIAQDAIGNIYFSDNGNNRIRKINTSGIISTVAGDGYSPGFGGYSGDGGPATNAELYEPQGISLDATGNIFIADINNNRIRMVNTSGIITTIAGNGYGAPFSGGYSGDGGAATAGELYHPTAVAVDLAGNVYIADQPNNRIRKVSTGGIITTAVGNGTGAFSGDGGQATAAEVYKPDGITVDASNNMYIADFSNDRIRLVNSSGIITTVAGNGVHGYSGDGGLPTAAELYDPAGVTAPDGNGNIYIVDDENNVVRQITNICMSFLNISVAHSTACEGSSATVYVNGGVGPYNYIWSNGTTSFSANNPTGNVLSAGTYTVIVKDVGGDSVVTTETITQPGALSVVVDSTNATSGCNGSAGVLVSGGTGPYTYSWSPGGGTSDTIKNRCTGPYCCKITDKTGCVDTVCVTIFYTLGINNIKNNSPTVQIYPNPTNGTFTIDIANITGSVNLNIYNALGQMVYTSKLNAGKSQVNLNNNAPGLYLYRILNETGTTIAVGKLSLQN
jgi:PKD repeat protein